MTTNAKGNLSPRTTKMLPFFSYDSNKNPLFSINENIPFESLLEHAHCFMISVEECMLQAARDVDNPSAWGAYYMAQIANALIESLEISAAKELRP